MNVLYITHGLLSSSYGAATSLRSHISLRHSSCKDRSVIIQRAVPKSIPHILAIASSFIKLFVFASAPDLLFKFSNNQLLLTWYFRFEFNFDGAPTEAPRFNKTKDLLSLICELYIFLVIRLFCPHVVHFNSITLVSTALRLRQIYKTSIPFVIHVREHPSSYTRPLLTSSTKELSTIHFICIEPTVRTCLLKTYPGLSDYQVSVIQNPFLKPKRDIPTFLKRIISDKFIFAYFGQISTEKNTHLLLQAFSNIHEKIPSAILLIIGSKADNFEHPLLPRRSQEFQHNIIYLPPIPELSQISIYQYIDVFIRPDPFFMTGRTTYESLLSGTPLLMTGNKNDLATDPSLHRHIDRISLIPYPLTVGGLSTSILDAYNKYSFDATPEAGPNYKPGEHCEYATNNEAYLKSIAQAYHAAISLSG